MSKRLLLRFATAVREARREASELSRESQEAMQMMSEIRKAHLQEVRLLQRGLQARGHGEMRNKVNETADLVDKLGRAVLQRDENLREKSKAQAARSLDHSHIHGLYMPM